MPLLMMSFVFFMFRKLTETIHIPQPQAAMRALEEARAARSGVREYRSLMSADAA